MKNPQEFTLQEASNFFAIHQDNPAVKVVDLLATQIEAHQKQDVQFRVKLDQAAVAKKKKPVSRADYYELKRKIREFEENVPCEVIGL